MSRCLRHGPGDRERGGATVVLLATGLVLVIVGLFGAAVGSAWLARQRVRVAADLAALAGAGQAVYGVDTACLRAAQIADRNGAVLTTCALDGLDVTVSVRVEIEPWPGLTRSSTATARAGPVRVEPDAAQG